MSRVDLVELIDDETIREKNGIEKEGLTYHKRQSQKRPLPVVLPHVLENFFPGRVISNVQLQLFTLWLRKVAALLRDILLNAGNDLIGVFLLASQHKPAGTLRQS